MDTDDPAVRSLYALPLAEFTAARNALAAELKRAGDKDGAAQVKALRKPSVVAWALNQLSSRHPDAVDRLLRAGEGLVKAQDDALVGDRPALRAATLELQAAENDAERLALSVLADDGRVAANVSSAIRATIHAAALDEAVGRQLRAGILTEDHQLVGFPDAGAMVDSPPRKPGPDPRAVRLAREQVQRLEMELTNATARADRLAADAARAQERADHAAEEARSAAAHLDDLNDRLADARQQQAILTESS